MPRFLFCSKKTKLVLLAFAFVIFFGYDAQGSWLINAKRYHVSVHGQTACLDCHEDLVDRDPHPNPENVTKSLTDFFNPDHCLACHDHIPDELEQGLHGSRKIEDIKAYQACLHCHNPHYQEQLEKDRPLFDAAKPRHEQCGVCHSSRDALPEMAPEEKACMACHGDVPGDRAEGKEKVRALCFHCHLQGGKPAQKITGLKISLINGTEYRSVPHADENCLTCHQNAAQYNHNRQESGDCGRCHLPHDEKVAHDAHMKVACEACHLGNINPVRDPESKRIGWQRRHEPGKPSRIHHMAWDEGEDSCRRCHFKANNLGAASMVLPAKSILCMPCHAATLSMGDTTTLLALVIFVAGMVLVFSIILSGSLPGKEATGSLGKLLHLLLAGIKAFFSGKTLGLLKALFLDVFLQRRLYQQSPWRWFVHSLIFIPFVFRFFWGLAALIGSLWKPTWSPVWSMLDKNHALTAVLFDLTGIMVILGIIFMLIRGMGRKSEQIPGLPKKDFVALGLIGGIVLLGFILEGMRIAMTGAPANARYAFIGYGISRLFSDPSGLTEIYGVFWYAHAIFSGAFIAYIPFSRLLHIILSPVVLAARTITEHK